MKSPMVSSVDVMDFLDREHKEWKDRHPSNVSTADQFGVARASLYLADLLNGYMSLDEFRAKVGAR